MYERQNFEKGQILEAVHLNHIEDGMVQMSESIEEASKSGGGRIANVELLASAWVGEKTPYSQVVSIPTVTPSTQVDLKPTAEQLSVFYNMDLAFVTENEDGVVTVYAIGQKPVDTYIIQATLAEVAV